MRGLEFWAVLDDIVHMIKRKTVKARRKKAARKYDAQRMSNLKLAYPANNRPTSVSDEEIEAVVRAYHEKHFGKSAL
jgi:hypothetical protein